MVSTLEAICDDLKTLRLQVSCLERVQALLLSIQQEQKEAPPQPTPSINSSRTTTRETNTTNPTGAEVYDYIVAHGPVTRRELLDALGGKSQAIDNKLKYLVAKGGIATQGTRRARRYIASRPSKSVTASSPAGDPSSSHDTPDRGVYPVYDAIIDLGKATTAELAHHTSLPLDVVVEQGRNLIRLGLVRFTGVGKMRVWLPAQSREIREAA